ncbi:MAG TPA: SpoIID/LytB domain-containing protein [Baekduia sp.]|nr:SpoIID/LytB domain-containing protein [Baekduia sp.]
MRRLVSASAAAAATLAAVPAADAATRFVVKGAGYGHGIGMSQYGALGFAKQGYTHDRILRHYYTQTQLGKVSPSPTVRVLLQQGRSTVTFSGAVAAGTRRLSRGRTYSARARAGRVALRSPSGRTLATYDAPLRIAAPGGGALRLHGAAQNGTSSGLYRGALELRPAGGALNAINAVDMEDYVRGVISAESPASWPIEALKAQAVAARSYALTTTKGGDGWDQYADVRSQMYQGVKAEFPSTDRATRETAGQIVTYGGQAVTTFFFSTSGGETENIENSFIGAVPKPWLKGVKDPFDDASPKHRWRLQMTAGQAAGKLGGLVKGSFRGIKVLERGVSPRVVRAEVLGSRGRTTTTGPVLRARLGLFDTWATFTTISSKATREEPRPEDPPAARQPSPEGGTEAGASMARARARGHVLVLRGRIDRAPRGAVVGVQRRVHGGWRTVGRTRATAGGRYRAVLPERGTYRVVFRGAPGPRLVAR